MKGDKQLKNQEGLRDFTFTNDYVFCSILTENPHICKEIAELAIGRKIKEIVKVQAQKSVKESIDGKGVRFDVVFEDDENSIYDIEMQSYNRGDLPKRARYYQSLLDLESLERGKSYVNLKNGYIIFICTFDLFGKGDYRYVARTMIENYPDRDYDDGSLKIFLNAAYEKDDMDQELRGFLDYVKSGQIQSSLASELERIKNKLLNNAERRERFMTLQEINEMHEEIGALKKVFALLLKGKLTKQDAIEESGLTEAEFEQALEEYNKEVAGK